jgi:hypothetical protein
VHGKDRALPVSLLILTGGEGIMVLLQERRRGSVPALAAPRDSEDAERPSCRP